MKKIRLWALLLTVLMLTSIVAGCSGDKDPPSTTPVPGSGTTKGPDETTAPVKLNGYEFILAAAPLDKLIPEKDRSELDNRKLEAYEKIQEEYDFKLSFIPLENSMESAISAVMAGDKIGDFIMIRHSDFFPLSVSGYLIPMDGDKLKSAGLDVTDATKWSQEYTQMSYFNGYTWALSTNGEFFPFTFGYQMAFNDTITKQAGYDKEAIYNLVKQGKWTWDVFLSICRDVTKDTDGDGTLDQFGNTSWTFGAEILTNQTNPIYRDNTGKWVCDFTDTNVIEGLTFLRDSQQANVVKSAVTKNGDLRKQFTNGHAAFVTVYYGHLIETIFKDSMVEYGLVPLPKGPNAKTYVHIVPDLDAWVMLTTNQDYEKSIIAMNAWGDIMTDDLWKNTVKEVFRDETSWEIFNELVLPNTVLNNLKITDEIWKYYQEHISEPVRLDIALPAVVADEHNNYIQSLLDSAFNK